MTAPPRQTMLATAPVSKLIWTFAIPAILSQVVNSMHNIVDQTFLGWGIGDLAIAATNIAFPLSTLTTALAALIGMGGAAGSALTWERSRHAPPERIGATPLCCRWGWAACWRCWLWPFWSRALPLRLPQRP